MYKVRKSCTTWWINVCICSEHSFVLLLPGTEVCCLLGNTDWFTNHVQVYSRWQRPSTCIIRKVIMRAINIVGLPRIKQPTRCIKYPTFIFVIKLYMFRASSVPIIRSYLLYAWQIGKLRAGYVTTSYKDRLLEQPVFVGCGHIAYMKRTNCRAYSRSVFLNRRAATRYRAPASIIPGRERPEETTMFYKISLVQLITNLNVILYLSICHTVYISVLILFMIMP